MSEATLPLGGARCEAILHGNHSVEQLSQLFSGYPETRLSEQLGQLFYKKCVTALGQWYARHPLAKASALSVTVLRYSVTVS